MNNIQIINTILVPLNEHYIETQDEQTAVKIYDLVEKHLKLDERNEAFEYNTRFFFSEFTFGAVGGFISGYLIYKNTLTELGELTSLFGSLLSGILISFVILSILKTMHDERPVDTSAFAIYRNTKDRISKMKLKEAELEKEAELKREFLVDIIK
jgi:hypothetical protein